MLNNLNKKAKKISKYLNSDIHHKVYGTLPGTADTDTYTVIQVLEQVIQEFRKKENIQRIPLDVFADKRLGILESVVKYLKEQQLSYHDIAIILNRDDRTIWATYQKACGKHEEKFAATDEFKVDVTIFGSRDKAPLDALITYLLAKGMTIKQISIKLDRSYKNIWLTHNKNPGQRQRCSNGSEWRNNVMNHDHLPANQHQDRKFRLVKHRTIQFRRNYKHEKIN